ncbi:hypothetical protein M422DRAFT_248751 [Sphaerobolus stellatus SS14]|nr:hypothetical protein M422DRAFT_248751 [Sphaerobolus stellatus SS14]
MSPRNAVSNTLQIQKRAPTFPHLDCDKLIHGPSSPVQNTSECNVPCSGDPSTICDAALRINIFSTPTPPTVPPPIPTPFPAIVTFAGNATVSYQFQTCSVNPRNPRALLHQVNLLGLMTPDA